MEGLTPLPNLGEAIDAIFVMDGAWSALEKAAAGARILEGGKANYGGSALIFSDRILFATTILGKWIILLQRIGMARAVFRKSFDFRCVSSTSHSRIDTLY